MCRAHNHRRLVQLRKPYTNVGHFLSGGAGRQRYGLHFRLKDREHHGQLAVGAPYHAYARRCLRVSAHLLCEGAKARRGRRLKARHQQVVCYGGFYLFVEKVRDLLERRHLNFFVNVQI